MRLAVYAPDSAEVPLVLTPECLQPSLQCFHEFGQMQFKGTVELDDHLANAIGRPFSSLTAEFECVVYDGYAVRTVEALMQRLTH